MFILQKLATAAILMIKLAKPEKNLDSLELCKI